MEVIFIRELKQIFQLRFCCKLRCRRISSLYLHLVVVLSIIAIVCFGFQFDENIMHQRKNNWYNNHTTLALYNRFYALVLPLICSLHVGSMRTLNAHSILFTTWNCWIMLFRHCLFIFFKFISFLFYLIWCSLCSTINSFSCCCCCYGCSISIFMA